jgi:hypothetical protein
MSQAYVAPSQIVGIFAPKTSQTRFEEADAVVRSDSMLVRVRSHNGSQLGGLRLTADEWDELVQGGHTIGVGETQLLNGPVPVGAVVWIIRQANRLLTPIDRGLRYAGVLLGGPHHFADDSYAWLVSHTPAQQLRASLAQEALWYGRDTLMHVPNDVVIAAEIAWALASVRCPAHYELLVSAYDRAGQQERARALRLSAERNGILLDSGPSEAEKQKPKIAAEARSALRKAMRKVGEPVAA